MLHHVGFHIAMIKLFLILTYKKANTLRNFHLIDSGICWGVMVCVGPLSSLCLLTVADKGRKIQPPFSGIW